MKLKRRDRGKGEEKSEEYYCRCGVPVFAAGESDHGASRSLTPPSHHFPAGGGRQYNEVPPINQVTGHGSEGDRDPFSFYWGDSCFIENGCDALAGLEYNLSRQECHLFVSAEVIY
ncbi:hypothetical protein E2C01_093809 [Portunus trituberculatus]|uniref:Uncharacterized protein n=1 Tax=Portunus trituberculatus TaxID=210409 RepID=A0A5B7JZQ8_PORTR|nr:hypothetical protein [Portunus trituberculatus]